MFLVGRLKSVRLERIIDLTSAVLSDLDLICNKLRDCLAFYYRFKFNGCKNRSTSRFRNSLALNVIFHCIFHINIFEEKKDLEDIYCKC